MTAAKVLGTNILESHIRDEQKLENCTVCYAILSMTLNTLLDKFLDIKQSCNVFVFKR